jgi:REP element-mobilizing transposase RayT
MSIDGYKIRDQYAIHFITFSVVEWIDLFTRKDYANIVVDSLNYCRIHKGLKVHAWCIMSNHLHLMLSATLPECSLSDIIRDFKKFTSQQIIKAIENNLKESRKGWMLWIFKSAGKQNIRNEKYQLWQQDNHPIECYDNSITKIKLNYIHENPLRAGIVRSEWEYMYSSAIDYYCNQPGLIKIDYI